MKAIEGVEVSIAEPASMTSAIITIILAKIFLKEKIMLRFLGTSILIVGAFILFI